MKVGIVIGAGGGIGSACTRALASSVDVTLLVGRDEGRLRATAAGLDARTDLVPADIATEEGRESIAHRIQDVGGEIGWLVLASGVPLRGPLPHLAPEAILRTFIVNLVGPALLLRRLLDCPWRSGAGIVVIGSISASRALPDRSVYSAAKAGLEHLAHSLAAEVASRGIRVNVVSPGVIDTPFLGEARQSLQAWVAARVPQGRAGTPDEVANVVRYLAVDAPAYVTGARITIDGGAESMA